MSGPRSGGLGAAHHGWVAPRKNCAFQAPKRSFSNKVIAFGQTCKCAPACQPHTNNAYVHETLATQTVKTEAHKIMPRSNTETPAKAHS